MNRHQTSDAIPATIRGLVAVAIAAVAAVGTFVATPAPVARAAIHTTPAAIHTTPAAIHTTPAAIHTTPAAVHTVAHDRAVGRAVAMRRLAHAPLPPGATQVATDPEAVTKFQWLHFAVPDTPLGSNVVDLHRFFRMPEQPAAAFRWLLRHRPRGFTVGVRRDAVVHGRTVERSVSFVSAGARDEITQQGLGFALTAARAGGTAVRVEAWVVWFLPRPAFERIPADVHAVAVSLDGPGAKSFPVSTITDPASVATLIRSVNSLTVVQPDSAVGCDPSPLPRIDLGFAPAVGAAPIARAVEDGCVALNFSVHGRRGPNLSIGFLDLADLLWNMHAAPVCAPEQLSGSARRPERSSPLDPSNGTLLQLTNVSQSVCGLKGFARIQLRGADGGPLLTRTANLDMVTPPVMLAPNTAATIALVWGDTPPCHRLPAASIDVTPPGLTSALTIGSLGQPLRQCDGPLYVTPVEETLDDLE